MRGVLVWVVVACMALVAGCGSQRASSAAGQDGDASPPSGEVDAESSSTSDGEVAGTIEGGPWGVGVSTAMTFAEPRRVVGITLEVGGGPADVTFYPEDFNTDEGVFPDEHDVRAGEPLYVQGHLFPPCVGEPDNSPPVMEVSFTRGGGDVEVERLEVETLDYFADPPKPVQVEDVVRAWCEAGVQVNPDRSSVSARTGDARVGYQVINPGPGDITLISRAGSQGDRRWREAGPVTVPAGESVVFFVEGEGNNQACGLGPLRLGLMEATGPDGTQILTTENPNGIC